MKPPEPAAETVPFDAAEWSVDASSARRLTQLAEQAARCTPDCCAAAATVTDVTAAASTGLEEFSGVTHPDLMPLIAVQGEYDEGPIPEALGSGLPTGADDLLHDDRWPRYRARALDAGVRSTATVPHRRGDLVVTVTVCSFRPHRAFDGDSLSSAVRGSPSLLADLAADVLVRDRRYREALVEVEQLDTALRSRPVVDQACGIIMHVLACDADEALDLLRRMSQRSNRKLHDLAEALVRSRGRGAEAELRAFQRRRGPENPKAPAR